MLHPDDPQVQRLFAVVATVIVAVYCLAIAAAMLVRPDPPRPRIDAWLPIALAVVFLYFARWAARKASFVAASPPPAARPGILGAIILGLVSGVGGLFLARNGEEQAAAGAVLALSLIALFWPGRPPVRRHDV